MADVQKSQSGPLSCKIIHIDVNLQNVSTLLHNRFDDEEAILYSAQHAGVLLY